MKIHFLAPLLLVTAALLVPSAAAGPDVDAAVFYWCFDEPPYPTDPSYSGDFCIDGQLGAECLVQHHWTDSNGPGETCYVESPIGSTTFESQSSVAIPVKCVSEPPYPTDPDYSGGFCIYGGDCTVMHYWNDKNGPDSTCYFGRSGTVLDRFIS